MLTTTSHAARSKSRPVSGVEPAFEPAPGWESSSAVAKRVASKPIEAAEFADLMAAFAPFEASPMLAIAVSGGPDSLALCLLSHEWAVERGGRVAALTVDHGLRSASAHEAARVGGWLRVRGIEQVTLPWSGTKPQRVAQARAREARYGLLRKWCRERSVLHLLVAHHADDQGETLLIRAGRASGFAGLAGMTARNDADAPRLLRPLLDLPSARLKATLRSRGQQWIEDPSNRDLRFERVRVRAGLMAEGRETHVLSRTASRIGAIRAFDEALTNDWLARYAYLHPAGFAWLDLSGLRRAPRGLAKSMLSRAVSCIGGRGYPVRQRGLTRTLENLAGTDPRRATIGGCLLAPRGKRLLVCRESRRSLPVLLPEAGQPELWDNRFVVETRGSVAAGKLGLRVQALGRRGWEQIAAHVQIPAKDPIPGPVRFVVPALWRNEQVVAAPHVGYQMMDEPNFLAFFQPLQPFVPPYFAVARARNSTI